MGGFGPMTGMMLGEVTPGGTGSGLYTILIYAVIAVFIGGLMIGRTPEYLGKKIQAREVKLAGLAALVMPVTVLVLHGHRGVGPCRAGRPAQRRSPRIQRDPLRPHLAGQQQRVGHRPDSPATRPSTTSIGAIDMLIGRFGIMIPALALGGVLAAKNVVPASLGTFRTDNGMFVGLTIGVIIIIGGLTFFPAVSLGPIVEQLSHGKFF